MLKKKKKKEKTEKKTPETSFIYAERSQATCFTDDFSRKTAES